MICVDCDPYCENCTFFCDHFGEYAVGESFEVYFSKCGSNTVCEDALSYIGVVYNEEENEWQTAKWFKECKEEDEIENQPKKEIKVGDQCKVIGGSSYHLFPIGATVNIKSLCGEAVFECKADNLIFSQHIETKDLVVVE